MMEGAKTVLILLAIVALLIPQFGAEVTGQAKDELERLLKDLKDPSWQMRWYGASALGDMKETRAVEPLIATLKNDDNGYVRAMAAWALGQIKDRRAIEPLIDGITDESSDVRKRSPQALKQITGQDFGKDQAKWREWWEKNR
jgi:HEAT repeat protein